jgi:hypothetical protein
VDIGDFEMYIGLKIKLIQTTEVTPAHGLAGSIIAFTGSIS